VRYREELDDLVLWDASHRLLELIAVSDVAEGARAQLDERVKAERAKVDARDAELEVLRHETKAAEQQAERAQNAAFLSDNDVREQESRIERAADRYAHLESRLVQARQEQRALEEKVQRLADERATLREQLSLVESEQSREEE